MNKIKRTVILNSLFFSLLAVFAHAALDFASAFDPVISIFRFFLSDLPSSSDGIVFFKIILWLGFYVIFLVLVPNLPFLKDKGGSVNQTAMKWGKILAMVLSLMVILQIPDQIILDIFNLYSFFAALILYFGVPVLLLLMTKGSDDKPANGFVRGLVFIMAGVFIFAFSDKLGGADGYSQDWAQGILAWSNMAGSIMMLFGLISIISQFLKGAGNAAVGGARNVSKGASWLKDKFGKKSDGSSSSTTGKLPGSTSTSDTDAHGKNVAEQVNELLLEVKNNYYPRLESFEYIFREVSTANPIDERQRVQFEERAQQVLEASQQVRTTISTIIPNLERADKKTQREFADIVEKYVEYNASFVNQYTQILPKII